VELVEAGVRLLQEWAEGKKLERDEFMQEYIVNLEIGNII